MKISKKKKKLFFPKNIFSKITGSKTVTYRFLTDRQTYRKAKTVAALSGFSVFLPSATAELKYTPSSRSNPIADVKNMEHVRNIINLGTNTNLRYRLI